MTRTRIDARQSAGDVLVRPPYPTWRLNSTMRIAMGCCVLSEAQKEMYVECRSGVNGRPRHGGTRWLESGLERQASRWTTSRCVEVKQRGSTPRGGGVATRSLRRRRDRRFVADTARDSSSEAQVKIARAWDPRTHEQTARDRDPRILETKRA